MANFNRSPGVGQPFNKIFVFPLIMTTDPTTGTPGELGQIAINTTTPSYWILSKISASGLIPVYTWLSAAAGGATNLSSLTVNPGNLTVTAGNLAVSAGTITSAGTISSSDGLTAGSAVVAGTTLSVGTNATIGGTLAVTGTSTFTGNVTFSGDVAIDDIVCDTITTTGAILGGSTITSTTGLIATTTVTAGTGLIVSAGGINAVPVTGSSASTPIVLNGRLVQATFTGFTTAAGSSQTFVITNSSVSATNAVTVSVSNQGANDAQMTIQRVLQASGSLSVTVKNNGAAALNGNVLITVNVWN